MANQKLLKKVAPVVLSAAMAMTSMPTAAMAADFSDSDVVSDAVEVEETQDAEADAEVDIEESDENTADVDVVEDNETGEDTSEEELFSSEVTEDEFSDQVGKDQTTGEAYVLMNIPYDDFYKAELKNNNVKVDAFTSATLNKSRTAGMMNGNSAYHVDPNGTDVTGVTFPVKVSDISLLKNQKKVTDSDSVTITVTNRGQTASNTYTGKDSLIENASYSYYILSEAPSYYKELTVNSDGSFSFSDVKGAEEKTVKTTAEFTTETGYGDYQLDIDSDTFASLINTNSDKIYGVTVNTTDGTGYGMRHLENIWRGYELAWCTGFTTTVHGGPTSSEHYKSMMGKTIDSVTYYTDKGIITFDIDDEKVLVTTGVTAEVEGIHTTDTKTTVALSGALPKDFSAKYMVDGTEVEYKAGKITVGSLEAGSHTCVISDKNGKYAPIQASFSVKEANVPVVYDSKNSKLVAADADGITEDQLGAYIKTITSVTVGDTTYAASGRGSKVIVKEDGTLDLSGLEVEDGTKFIVTSSAYDDLEFSYAAYQYVYAGLTWAQYWAAEGVYAAGNASSSDAKDRRGETDLGAFDTVTRATTNHGLHRGSFQAVAVIEGNKGSYTVSYWEGKNTVVFADGKKAEYNRGTLTFEDGTTDEMVDYKVTGLKYVPVKVKSTDYEAFKNAYAVVEKDGTLTGGFGEMNLQSYSLTADVTADTNGLKTAVKNEDGSFSFSERANGSESGIKDTALKTAEGVEYTVKPGNGSYGEFLRVDLTGNYGDLGGAMQAVKWTYYGNDSTYTKALQSYGTKFAADNWMHKAMGIQLGLTESQRCQLPQGYDGTGYWTLTVYALGYADYTIQFQATEDNIAKPAGDADSTPLKNIIEEAKALKESDYTPESWAVNYESIQNELQECEEMLENIAEQTQYGVNEQIGHLREAIDTLVKAEFKLNATSGTLYTQDKTSTTLKVTTNLTGTVTWKSDNAKIATVSSKGVVTAKAAGVTTITATLGNKTATYKVTVKNAMTINKTAVTVYVGGAPASYTLKATSALGGTVKYTTNNKNVATVNSKGVVTAKKAGTAVITVTVGKYKKTCKVTVKNPSITVKAGASTIYVGKQTKIAVTKLGASGTAKFATNNKNIATVNSKGVVTAKKAGTAVITVTVGKYKKTCKVTVKNPSITVKAGASTIYVGKQTKIAVTKYGVSGTAKFTTSNKSIATVNSKGVVTAKKAGTVKITVQVGKYKKVVTVKVKAASLKLAKTAATINKGKTTTIKVSAVPSGKVTYTSNNTKVATVTSKGVVKGVKKGIAVITVKCNGMTAKFKVTVK